MIKVLNVGFGEFGVVKICQFGDVEFIIWVSLGVVEIKWFEDVFNFEEGYSKFLD